MLKIRVVAHPVKVEAPFFHSLQFPFESHLTPTEWQFAPGALQSMLGKPPGNPFWFWFGLLLPNHWATVTVDATVNKTKSNTKALCIFKLFFFYTLEYTKNHTRECRISSDRLSNRTRMRARLFFDKMLSLHRGKREKERKCFSWTSVRCAMMTIELVERWTTTCRRCGKWDELSAPLPRSRILTLNW